MSPVDQLLSMQYIFTSRAAPGVGSSLHVIFRSSFTFTLYAARSVSSGKLSGLGSLTLLKPLSTRFSAS